MKKYFPHILLVAYIVEFIVLAISPVDRAVWLTENLTVLPIVVILAVMYMRNIRLSNLSYFFMSILIYMHTIGGHYTFALVPFDWFNNFFGFERNMYDRVAHAMVGLFAYPIIEELIRYRVVNRKWFAYLSAICIMMAVAAGYEIFEWRYAIQSDPSSGLAVLGSQGDIWDAQKDMLMDALGAIFASTLHFLVNRKKAGDVLE